MGMVDVRAELVGMRAVLDGGEFRWLGLLGEFDAREGWADEGFLSPVAWLEANCGLSRVAASERVRIARQLRRRPVFAAAVAAGGLSYSKVRAIARLDPRGVDEVDRVLVEFAAVSSATDVERLVQQWRAETDGRDPTVGRFDRAGVTASTTYDGMGVIELVTAAEDHHELLAIIDANVERRYHLDQRNARDGVVPGTTIAAVGHPEPSPLAVPAGTPRPVEPVGYPDPDPDRDEVAVPAGTRAESVDAAGPDDPVEGDVPAGTPADDAGGVPAGTPVGGSRVGLRARRAAALAELVRVGHAHIDRLDDSSGADRYTLNLVATVADLTGHRHHQPTLGDGQPVSIDTALRVACDCAVVRHLVSDSGEPLDVGRKTRVWTAGQRRAVRRRDRNRCRFPGCRNRVHDVHHITHWAAGGTTAVDNGCLLCTVHHQHVHERGWTVTGNPNATLTFTSPTGFALTSPLPAAAPRHPVAA